MSRDVGMEQKMGVVAIIIFFSILKFPVYFDPSSIRGYKVLLTDTDTVLGREVALQYASHKTELFLVSRNETSVRKLADQCLTAGAVAVHTWTGDLTDPADRAELVQEAEIRFGGHMNHLVMNHYQEYYEPSPWDSSPAVVDRMQELNRMMNLHFLSYVDLASRATPLLVKRKGSIGAVMPLVGKIPVAKMAAYSASFAAVTGFFPALRQEFWQNRFPVSITSIALGHVVTEDQRSSAMGKGYPFADSSMAEPIEFAASSVISAVSLKKTELTYPFVSQTTFGLYNHLPGVYEYLYAAR